MAEINKQADPNLLWDTIKMAIRGEAIKSTHRISCLEKKCHYFYTGVYVINTNKK